MKITPEQKKAILAAGYTVGKSGTTILDKEGASVGGYNENGQIWSGSTKVRNLLKPVANTTKPATKPAPKKPLGKTPVKGVKTGEVISSPISKVKGGRGDGMAEVIKRKADAALSRVTPADEARAAKRKAEPRAAGIYDKVYGSSGWTPKGKK